MSDSERSEVVVDSNVASRTVLGRGSLYTLSTAAPILVAILVTPFVTRRLGASEYGAVATALVVIQAGAMIGGLGLAAAITRHGILEESGRSGARSLVAKSTALSSLGVVAALATGELWGPVILGVPWRLASAFALVASFGCIAVLNVQSLLRVLDRPGAFVGLSVLATFGGPVVGVALLQSPQADADDYVLGMLFGYMASAACGLIVAFSSGNSRGRRGDLVRALRVGVPVIPHQVALYLANGAVVILAGAYLGGPESGRMQLAFLLGTAPATIINALNNSWAPVIYQTAIEDRGRVLERTARDVASLACLMVSGVVFLAPWLLSFLAPASYSPSSLIVVVAVVATGSLISVAYLSNVHLIFAAGRSAGLALVTPLSLALAILTAVSLARLGGGLVGIAVGFPLTYALLVVGTSLLRRKVSPISWRERRVAPPILFGFVGCAAGAVMPLGAGYDIARMLVSVGLIAVSVFFLIRIARR